jgi:hypothetical protein
MSDLTDYKHWKDVDIAGNQFLIQLEPAMMSTGSIIQRSLRGNVSPFPEPILFDREFVKEKIKKTILIPIKEIGRDEFTKLIDECIGEVWDTIQDDTQ